MSLAATAIGTFKPAPTTTSTFLTGDEQASLHPCFYPIFSISNVIYGGKIIVDVYPFTLFLACSFYNLEHFALIFGALRNAVDKFHQRHWTPGTASCQIRPPLCIAHRDCTRLGIAPELYGFENLVGGWKVIVMAYKDDGFATLFGHTLDGKIKAVLDTSTPGCSGPSAHL
ncbi:6412_t:CDS:2 [Paraglomus brasilianum]|uniref:6412_t:CDS:1 n=1 Tax=Paraglomus brasilianum TaxID=144538 RepID=A0A9N9G5T8_9GLOM|nr:6412_t:CDS:2 [Paraglomus brasilianum]